MVLITEKNNQEFTLMWTAFLLTANSTEEGMRIFFAWFNKWPPLTPFTIESCFTQKGTFEFIAISFLFFRAVILIRIWLRKRFLYGIFAFWYLIISFTIQCFIFSLFIIDYFNFVFLTCWYILISFFLLITLVLLLFCSFRCVFFRNFYLFFRIEERVQLFLSFFVLVYSARVYVTMKFCSCFDKYFFTHCTKWLGDHPANFTLVMCVHIIGKNVFRNLFAIWKTVLLKKNSIYARVYCIWISRNTSTAE